MRAVTWKSEAFVAETSAAGYLEKRGDSCFLSPQGIGLWFVVNPRPDPNADRRRDLVPYDEVLREFGVEIANKEARPPIEVRQRVDVAVPKLLDSVGYQHDAGRPA